MWEGQGNDCLKHNVHCWAVSVVVEVCKHAA